jgi:uncharacterized repeat protein (TIGR04052 family)
MSFAQMWSGSVLPVWATSVSAIFNTSSLNGGLCMNRPLRPLTVAILLGVLLSLLSVMASLTAAQHGHGEMGSPVPKVGPDVTIRFAAMVGDRPAACGMIYRGVGADQSTISLNDYRFYVSNVRLFNKMGKEAAVELTQDGLWQYDNVALLDFEDATSGCSESGTSVLNDKVVGKVPEGEYTAISFDLGVPFELNHLDTTTAPAPLNLPAMWWNWQIGYKFARLDLLTPEGATPAWLIHLGSTGCASSGSNTPPDAPCSNPNVTTVHLHDFNPLENFVVADLAGLVAAINLKESIPQPPGCMSGPEDSDCMSLFPGFGLDLATGTMLEDRDQTFFRVG